MNRPARSSKYQYKMQETIYPSDFFDDQIDETSFLEQKEKYLEIVEQLTDRIHILAQENLSRNQYIIYKLKYINPIPATQDETAKLLKKHQTTVQRALTLFIPAILRKAISQDPIASDLYKQLIEIDRD